MKKIYLLGIKWLRFVLCQYIPIVILITIGAVISLYIDLSFAGSSNYFQRWGAIMTLGGILCSTRRLIRMDFKDYIESERTIDGGTIGDDGANQISESDKDIRAMGWGLCLLLLGTFFSAYADLWTK